MTLGIFHKTIDIYQGEDFDFIIEFETTATITDMVFRYMSSDKKELVKIEETTEISTNKYLVRLANDKTNDARKDTYDLKFTYKENGAVKKAVVEKFIKINEYD